MVRDSFSQEKKRAFEAYCQMVREASELGVYTRDERVDEAQFLEYIRRETLANIEARIREETPPAERRYRKY